MKQIFINDNDLKIEDIDYSVIRVKGLVINSNDELILIENNNTFQFPGGHLRQDEPIEKCLAREIREELGIDVNVDNGPFMMITTYDNDYFDSGSRVCNEIYYFIVKTDLEPDANNLVLDSIEKESDFNIYKINIADLDNFLNNCLESGKIDPSIGREMLLVSATYNDMFRR